MTILVTGGQSTASAWVYTIVSRILETRGPLSDLAGLASIRSLRTANGGVQTPIFIRGCDDENVYMQLSSSHQERGANYNQHSEVAVPQSAVASFMRLVVSHDPVGAIIRSPLGDHLSPIIFTHRDPIDQLASYVRIYGLTPERLQAIENDKPELEVLYDARTNCKNYRVLVEDLKKSLVWKRGTLHHIRSGYLDILDARDEGRIIHPLRFTDITIDEERGTIDTLANHVKESARREGDERTWNIDTGKIQEYMQSSKVHGKNGFHVNGRKVGFGRDFFGETTARMLADYFGDTMVEFEYMKREDYLNFANSDQPIVLVHVGDHPELESQTRRMARRIVNIGDERFVSLAEAKFADLSGALIFVDERAGYRAVKSRLSSDTLIYPLYRARYGYRSCVFLLDDRRSIFQDELPSVSRSFVLVKYSDSTRRDSFDPLREIVETRGLDASLRTLEVERGRESRLATFKPGDCAILCTNNPMEVHTLARALPRATAKVAIIPMYRYRESPLFS